MSGWFDKAECRGQDPDLFIPALDETKAEMHARQKKACVFCSKCPVKVDCLRHAFENGERRGIWGGLSERQRRKIKEEGEVERYVARLRVS